MPRSGTNYLETFLQKNYSVKIAHFKYGWKHGFVPYEKCKINICIIKNIFSWLVSIFSYSKKSHEIKNKKEKIDDFIKSEFIWESIFFNNYQSYLKKNSFENILLKYENPLEYYKDFTSHYLNNFFCINYEDLLFENNKVIFLIEKELNLKANKDIIFCLNNLNPKDGIFLKNLNFSKHNNYEKIHYYKEKKYLNFFNINSINYINKFLSKNENSFFP